MKNIVLTRASGFVRTAVPSELLNRDSRVTAIVCSPEKVTIADNYLLVVKADVPGVEKITASCKGKDVVINAHNLGWANPNTYEETSKNYPLILKAVRLSGIKCLFYVGGIGTLSYVPGLKVADLGATPAEITDGMKSLGELYLSMLCSEKEVDWAFFPPVRAFEPGQRIGRSRLGKDGLVADENENSHISIENYVIAMVDELKQAGHHRERFTIGY